MKERYGNLDGVRGYACLGIIMMHVFANGSYSLKSFLFDSIVPSLTDLVYLFMLISAFSMCCGYYSRFKAGPIDLESFYRKRFQRIWPFFAVLCTVELIVDHSLTSLYEWVADLTLVFGFLPNADISVVGVGWFLGVIFVFYLVFPFLVFLLLNKKRAWFAFGIAILWNVLCQLYFLDQSHVVSGFMARTNFLYCAMFFVAGGLIYLYRDKFLGLVRVPFFVTIIVFAALLVLYYSVVKNDLMLLLLYALLTILVMREGKIRKAVFQNRVILFIANISMEMYLCHMFVFRTIESLKLLHFSGNELADYLFILLFTIAGAMAASIVLKKLIKIVSGFVIHKGKNSKTVEEK
jgi:peptidoglycan/LPS O-acetylase OafA/YrhL